MSSFSSRTTSLGIAVGWLLVTVHGATTPLLAARETTTSCAQLHMMIAGGCEPPCPVNTPGLLDTLIGNITSAFPGADQYFVPYDNSVAQGRVSTPLMIQAATDYAATCPETPIVFLGYSLGGIINMNTLCGGVSTSLVPNVLAAINYGEETFVYPESYDRGTCTQSAPLYARANSVACEPFTPAIQSYCDAQDPACCTGGSITDTHFGYPALYDLQALAFIQSRYAGISPTSTSTSTTAPTKTTEVPNTTKTSTTTTAPSPVLVPIIISSSNAIITAASILPTIPPYPVGKANPTGLATVTSSTLKPSSYYTTSAPMPNFTGGASGLAIPALPLLACLAWLCGLMP